MNRRSKVWGILMLCLFSSLPELNGLSNAKLNSVYIELGANGLFTSINNKFINH